MNYCFDLFLIRTLRGAKCLKIVFRTNKALGRIIEISLEHDQRFPNLASDI